LLYNNLRLVLGLGLVRASSRPMVRVRVKVRVSVLVRVSIRTNWVVNFALPASNLHSSPIFTVVVVVVIGGLSH